jgi:aconitase A
MCVIPYKSARVILQDFTGPNALTHTNTLTLSLSFFFSTFLSLRSFLSYLLFSALFAPMKIPYKPAHVILQDFTGVKVEKKERERACMCLCL